MAKDFSKSTGATALKAVAKKSNETANASFIIWVNDTDLENYPENEEMGFSLETTEDLEIAIEENGFTDPIEAVRLPEGKYKIISGHRRRLAGRNKGMTSFPVIVKEDMGEIKNRRSVLEANFRREMKPMQYAKLIAAWEEQLKREQMKGEKRKYISSVLNLSEAQISRYNSLNKMIAPLQELVDSGKIGLSSVSSIAKYSPEEQSEIFILFNQYLNSYDDIPEEDKYELLTRDKAKELITAYEDGIKDYEDIQQVKGQMNIEDEEFLSFQPDPSQSGAADTFSSSDNEPDIPSAPIPIYELDGEPYGATYNQIIVSLILEMNEYKFNINLIDGDRCSAFGKDYFAYNVNNDGFITIEDENENILFKVSIERFQSEYDFHVARLEASKNSLRDQTINPKYQADSKPETVNDELNDETDLVETVEADIIQTESEYDFDRISAYGFVDVKMAINEHQRGLATYVDGKLDAPIVKQTKMELDALMALEEGLYMHDMPTQERTQPNLPILKNNDQRKEFIEAYETWPIWIDIKETGERYYRYNLTDRVAIVVKVSLQHVYQGYNETRETDYTSPQYYLLGIKTSYRTKTTYNEDPSRTFAECSSNMTDIINYMKEFQKNNNE